MNKQEQLDALLKERELLQAQIKPLRERLSQTYDEVMDLKTQIDNEKLENSSKKEIDFEFILKFEEFETRPMRQERERQIKLLGLDLGGYFLDTLQNAIHIGLHEDNDIRTKLIHDSLQKVIPYIKPSPEHNLKVIDLDEHTLSEFCNWTLGINDGEFHLLRNNRISKSFSSLIELLKYCQKYHYKTPGLRYSEQENV